MNDIPGLSAQNIEILDSLIAKTQARLDNAPAGSLKIIRRATRLEYYLRLPGPDQKTVYISKTNPDLTRALAQKDYDIRVLKVLSAQRAALSHLESTFPQQSIESVYENLPAERRVLVKPVILSDEQFAAVWLAKPYNGLRFLADDSGSFYTDNGERVRSKSEIIIANFLKHKGIPYKYELPLLLDGHTLYPDFTILDVKRRRLVYLEHFGMMDDAGYAAAFVKKITFYQTNGIFPGENLITTFESAGQPLDTRLLEKIIFHYILI